MARIHMLMAVIVLSQITASDGSPGVYYKSTLGIDLELIHASTDLLDESGRDLDVPSSGLSPVGARYLVRCESGVLERRMRALNELAPDVVQEYSDAKAELVAEPAVFGCGSPLEWESPAARRTVRFTLSDGGVYRREVVGEPRQVSWLDGLILDHAFSCCLPPSGEVEEWNVDAREFLSQLWLGGVVPIGYCSRSAGTSNWPSVHVAIVPELPPDPSFWLSCAGGDVSARRSRKEGNRDVAVVTEFELHGRCDMIEWLEKSIAKSKNEWQEYVSTMGYEGCVKWRLNGQGKIVWDEKLQKLILASIRGRIKVEYRLGWSYDWDAPAIQHFVGERVEIWSGTIEMERKSYQ